MHVLGISGSPRKDGNTSILVKEVLEKVEGEKEFISLAGLNINPCRCCDRCWKEETECAVDDDIRWILRKLEACDAVVLGSPCYFKSVSAQLKMLMDRSVSFYGKGTLKDKVGAAVVTQDVNGLGGIVVVHTIRNFYDGHQILYAGGIVGEGGAERGNIRNDAEAMKKAGNLGERITELVTRCR
jgi:multimeric flavodoxin WrbA